MAKYDSNNYIIELEPNEVFVFGSNTEGLHMAGAAAIAVKKFGAIVGQANGLQGKSYAINTMSGEEELINDIDDFLFFTKQHPELTFLLTEIGCGIAGYRPEQVAPYFADCPRNIILPQSFKDFLESDS